MVRPVRLLAVAALLGATSRGVWWLVAAPLRSVPDLVAGHARPAPDQALVMVLAAVVLGGWLWCLVTATVLAVERSVAAAPGRSRAAGVSDRCPAPVRALVLAILGAGAAGVLAVPAHAEGQVAPAPRPAAALAGLPLPDRQAAGGTGTPVAAHVVRQGETLWSIAADRLPPDASAAAVDRAWRRLYAANRARVGPDPDLIRPGTCLALPHPPRKDDR